MVFQVHVQGVYCLLTSFEAAQNHPDSERSYEKIEVFLQHIKSWQICGNNNWVKEAGLLDIPFQPMEMA